MAPDYKNNSRSYYFWVVWNFQKQYGIEKNASVSLNTFAFTNRGHLIALKQTNILSVLQKNMTLPLTLIAMMCEGIID